MKEAEKRRFLSRTCGSNLNEIRRPPEALKTKGRIIGKILDINLISFNEKDILR